MKKIIIIGGGLAGLITAVKLIDAGIPCTVIEKKSFPFHRVCGEYVSNEAAPFLKNNGLFPVDIDHSNINTLLLSSTQGKSVTIPLAMGGFGISRYAFDDFIYREALRRGVTFMLNTEVSSVQFNEDQFVLKAGHETLVADVVVGAFGKRSRLDVSMQRAFTRHRSPYVGVKYHVRINHQPNVIGLHNFQGGYCGISNIEEGKTNLCYLTHRDQLKRFGNIPQFQEAILWENPYLKNIFNEAEFLFHAPETINEITFETKSVVEDHLLMTGDAAGMITPLCGNGMAMAIHSAKLLSELLIRFVHDHRFTREKLEHSYEEAWRKHFAMRLWRGRHIQRLFGHPWASSFAVSLARGSAPVAKQLVRMTHGENF
ncbi:NAD(P)/FAD-dependent oxidoreductase [Pseudochryseolinea flava]|uniref:FAD-dependent oxidoreductase n=1 Tax=Pseudochryseolinea flava TaxID=2059302 RepID=A0A364YBA0_9BACT|nr:FAD-dependent monooxygenase [Pseudochryseolinea flava]RAW03549.1 FAD-dependent oxidoreductase [Pseudochryseolinea flava]